MRIICAIFFSFAAGSVSDLSAQTSPVDYCGLAPYNKDRNHEVVNFHLDQALDAYEAGEYLGVLMNVREIQACNGQNTLRTPQIEKMIARSGILAVRKDGEQHGFKLLTKASSIEILEYSAKIFEHYGPEYIGEEYIARWMSIDMRQMPCRSETLEHIKHFTEDRADLAKFIIEQPDLAEILSGLDEALVIAQNCPEEK